MRKKADFKTVIYLGILDAVLFILPKLVSLLASFFGVLAKIPIIGIPFSLIQKLLEFIAKIGIFPFYVCTVILVILLILKLITFFKNRKKSRKKKQVCGSDVDSLDEDTTYEQDKMELF